MMLSHALIMCICNLRIIAGGGPSRLFPEFMADFVAISRISYRSMLKYVAKFLHGQGFLPEDIILKRLKPEADALRIVCTNSDTLTEWRVTVLAFVTQHYMKYCFQLHLLVTFTTGQYTSISREYLAQYSSLEIDHLGTQAAQTSSFTISSSLLSTHASHTWLCKKLHSTVRPPSVPLKFVNVTLGPTA
jgi:hypothetical protein